MEVEVWREGSDETRRGRDRNIAAAGAIFLARCLGIDAEPGFDLANSRGRDGRSFKALPFGQMAFKTLFDMGVFGEQRQLQLLLVDEAGCIVAESRQLYSLGKALDLLDRLPVPLAKNADGWLKDALGENRDVPLLPSSSGGPALKKEH